MTCSTCDGYEFVPNPAGGLNLDCPDCRAVDGRPLAWCPVHSKRLNPDLTCPGCIREAARGITLLMHSRAGRPVESAVVVA